MRCFICEAYATRKVKSQTLCDSCIADLSELDDAIEYLHIAILSKQEEPIATARVLLNSAEIRFGFNVARRARIVADAEREDRTRGGLPCD